MIRKKYNEQMGNYLAKLAQTQNNLGTWQERILAERKPTNADRIRSMSDEELAEWIADKAANHGGGCCAPGCNDCSIHPDGCSQPWLDWLRQEVSE